MSKTIREEIEEISTYHSDDGTSGYLLSDKQVDDLVALIEREKRDVLNRLETELDDGKKSHSMAVIRAKIKEISYE